MREAPMHTRDLLYGGSPEDRGPIGRAEKSWEATMAEANQTLEHFGLNLIDEVAIMFGSLRQAQDYISEAVMEPGVSHFNAAMDRVTTKPIRSEYAVRYDFLQKEGKPYRVECMTMDSGVSPLHSVITNFAVPQVIHMSFKTKDNRDYSEACEFLRSADIHMAQECFSTYGRFSYWVLHLVGSTIYLKPRVNLRDARINAGNISGSRITSGSITTTSSVARDVINTAAGSMVQR